MIRDEWGRESDIVGFMPVSTVRQKAFEFDSEMRFLEIWANCSAFAIRTRHN